MDIAFASFADFLQMGKHGFYVWLCYGLTLLVAIGNVVYVFYARKKLIRSIQDEQRRIQKRQENY